ncbi:DUF1329 domain-containing protein [Lichenicola cladoniae]|uniref:DUF1329 domain-containing protein n=1 Tax=Lichenicola cladoniae TaxID=1484109 RepID=A0A6M8HS40_9PROT|nr:DUF1329 domain-containing protein [Lichenicola cladoniae]NPD66010.1 DUF1329 domain-containing protein [Acetobacteraceae bacterium]QKE91011.1 DUF1329 domain-containing protein [Lichenicola cladoniae]
MSFGPFRFLALILPVALASPSLGAHWAWAKVSSDEARQLRSTLTPFGAQKAGNADNTIPAWTGGLTRLPPGVAATDRMPDFYKDDRKILTIDGSNADGYEARLSPGTIYLLTHQDGYRIEIYPTHRPAAAPRWFYDATGANAISADARNVNWVSDAKGGIPFPIPHSGKEAIWNLNLGWRGVQTKSITSSFVVPPDGTPTLTTAVVGQRWSPYADMSYRTGAFVGYYQTELDDITGPAGRAGDVVLSWQSMDQTMVPQITWQFLPGQRRLRRARQLTYDGASVDCGAIMTVDERSLFSGPPDRYDIALVGKQEMYVPYDDNGMFLHRSGDLLGPNYLNPDDVRWELHRVWVLDLTLAAGKHHLLPHRRLYLDEDSWEALVSEDYGADGRLSRIGQAFNYMAPALPALIADTTVIYDTHKAGYCLSHGVTSDHPDERALVPATFDPGFFSPNMVAAASAR